MSDAELRALERMARGDDAAAWSFVRALERVGDRRRAFLELCRLARAGDKEALAAVGPPQRRFRGLRWTARIVEPAIDGRLHIGREVFSVVGYSTSRVSKLEGGSPIWTATGDGKFVLVGSDVAIVGSSLELLSGATGKTIARVPCDVVDPVVHDAGDRAFVIDRHDGSVRVLDLGESFGSELWRLPPATFVAQALKVATSVRDVLVGQRREIVVRDTGTGEVRWRRSWHVLGAADERNVVAGAIVGRDLRLRFLDAASGELLWERRQAGVFMNTLLGDEVVLFQSERGLAVVERASGNVLWERAGGFAAGAASLSSDTVFCIGRDPRRVLLGLDARSGERVLELALPEGMGGSCQVLPGGELALCESSSFWRIVRE